MDEIRSDVLEECVPNDGTSMGVPPKEDDRLVPVESKDERKAEDKENSANDENLNGANKIKYKKIARAVSKSVVGILACLGLASYGVLGYIAAEHFSEDGLYHIIADSIFGGAVDKIYPIIDPNNGMTEEHEGLTDDREESPNSANAENVDIRSEDISCSEYTEVLNETKYDPREIAATAAAIPNYTEDTAVLIIHTHGTESYGPDNGKVSADENFRNGDISRNVISVGTAFAEKLRSGGVTVYHCTEMFDEKSYIDAYDRSGKAVREYIKKYPEISYVLDIHRDAVIREDGTVVKTDGGAGAQMMIVCGTDEMGADFPHWQENFSFASEYQRRLFEGSPKRVRHMNLRSASFNQQLAKRYLLLEIGSCGNTLDEAICCANYGAEVFLELIKGEGQTNA